MVSTDWPLRTVASKSGFRHLEYMGAVFRSGLGRTPDSSVEKRIPQDKRIPMKARLVPVYFDPGRDAGLRQAVGGPEQPAWPTRPSCSRPWLWAARCPRPTRSSSRSCWARPTAASTDFQAIRLPILIVTSEFGTLSMWDWEIIELPAVARRRDDRPLQPRADARPSAAPCGVKRELRRRKFLVYQDNPGEGLQASIFKRFYWWEDECTERMREQVRRRRSSRRASASWAPRAKAIPDAQADEAWQSWRRADRRRLGPRLPQRRQALPGGASEDLDADPAIRAVGINCLNESHFSDTTPCLAWNMLYQERGLIWGCEADTLSMLTKYLLHHSLGAPIMMTNLYPFLMGKAALKHERIDEFPAGRASRRTTSWWPIAATWA